MGEGVLKVLTFCLIGFGVLSMAVLPSIGIWRLMEEYPQWKRVAVIAGFFVFVVFWTYQAASPAWQLPPNRI